MSLSIIGQVTDIHTSNAVQNATVVITRPDSQEVIYWTTTTAAGAGPGGYFTFQLTLEEMFALLEDRHHTPVIFKVYDGVVFLGWQEVVLSALTFSGTPTLAIAVDSTYTAPTSGLLFCLDGKVVEVDGSPIAGLDIEVYDRDIVGETLLESVTSASDGRFLIRYGAPPGLDHHRARRSLIVRAYDGETLVATAGPLCNPRDDLVLVMVRDENELLGPPEWDATRAQLDEHRGSVPYHQLSAEQVHFLGCMTGIPEIQVAMIARAHRLADELGLDAAIFYAIARAGYPLATGSVLSLDDDRLEELLLQAIDDHAISATIADGLATIQATLAAARLDHIHPPTAPEGAPLGEILATAALDPGKARAFVEAFIDHQGSSSALWDDLRADAGFGDAVVDTLQFTLEIGALGGTHLPLIKLLQEKRGANVFARASELAQLDESDWLGFLAEEIESVEVGAPAGIPGDDENERRTHYARALARMVEDLYPTAHLAYHLPEGAATGDIADFVARNPDFSLLTTGIDEFLATAEGLPAEAEDRETLRRDLRRVQRVARLVPRYHRSATAGVLLAEGIASAQQIRAMGPASFQAAFGGALGGPEVAASIYRQADAVATTALHTLTRIRPELVKPAMTVFTTPGCVDPDLAAIFGSLDYCACRHCESVLGPAAYFVDIVNYLRAPQQGADPALPRILARRPELLHIGLGCTNAETPLPTLDLINEVLERAVLGLHAINPHPDPATWPQTTWDPGDLLAHPEKTYPEVYDTYLSDAEDAVFPWSLPFDLSLEEARIYLAHLGIERVDLQDHFEWFSGEGGQDLTSRVDERLGLSPAQGQIVRDLANAANVWKYWGFTSAAGWITAMNQVETFLERSELDVHALPGLLRLGLLADTEIHYETPCQLKGATFRRISEPETLGWTAERAAKFAIMLRLSRSLGWSLFDLDGVLLGLNIDLGVAIDDALIRLARFVRVRRRFPHLALGEVLAWWSPLDIRRPDPATFSFYEQIVRPNTREPEFASDLIDSSGLSLGDALGSLLGILQIDEASLGLALGATGLTKASALNLDHLSRLFRISSLARACKRSIRELVTLTRFRVELSVGDPGPFAGTSDAPVALLLELAAAVSESPFTVATLDFILRDRDPESFSASPAGITRTLLQLIVALQAADADLEASLPGASQPAELQALALLARLYEGDDYIDRRALIDTIAPADADAAQAAAARDLLFPYLDPAGDAYTELGKAFSAAAEPTVRAALLLPELIAHLGDLRRQRTVVQQLAATLDIEPADLQAYLSHTAKLAIFCTDAFVHSFDPLSDAASAKEELFPNHFLGLAEVTEPATILQTLHKVALIVRGFGFTAGILRWLLIHAPTAAVEILDLTALPSAEATPSEVDEAYRGWDWLRRLILLRDRNLRRTEDLPDLLERIFSGSWAKETTLVALAHAAGWDPEALLAFEAPHALTQADFQGLGAWEALATAVRLGARIGVDPTTLYTWASSTVVVAAQANHIKGVAQAKHNAQAWASIAEPLRGRLRERQRDALADYLVPRLSGVGDRDALFEHFLFDPEVSACHRTSRLLFGTTAVQLFVQRALMGLEGEVRLDGEEWAWMRRYRAWEANRKIFLHPENWALPELRQDKSELFRQVEEALSQGELTDEAIERAFVGYLEGLHDIARLEICGLHHQQERDPITHELTVDILHVFGRMISAPGRVFYRQQQDGLTWTAWEELPFPVGARHLIPVIANRRLLLMWPRFEEKPDPPPTGKIGSPSNIEPQSKKHRLLRMVCAERRGAGWSGPRTTEEGILHDHEEVYGKGGPLTVLQQFYFTTHVDSKSGMITVYVGYHQKIGDSQLDSRSDLTYDKIFRYDACRGDFVPGPRPTPHQYVVYGGPTTEYAFFPLQCSAHEQAFIPNSIKLVPHLQLPIRDPITHQFEYPHLVIDTPEAFQVLFPRHDHIARYSRPFSFSDSEATLLLREVSSGSGGFLPEKSSGAGKDPATLAQATLIPYIGLDVQSEAAVQSEGAHGGVAAYLSGGANAATQASWGFTSSGPRYRAEVLYHPYACLFLAQVRLHGVDGLFKPEGTGILEDLRYQRNHVPLAPRYLVSPKHSVLAPYPVEEIDFSANGAYSVYNWEIFYHLPMVIADRLLAEGKYDSALRWLHYIFNPNREGTKVSESDCAYYWQIRPFREAAAKVSIDALLELLHYHGSDPKILGQKRDLQAQIAIWRRAPFQPHAVAQARPTAYMRAVVMRYLDVLIAWGDALFHQDTLESTNEAVLYYALARQLLGRRPRQLPAEERPLYTLEGALEAGLDDFSNFLVEIENQIIPAQGEQAALPLDGLAQLNLQLSQPEVQQLAYIPPADGPPIAAFARSPLSRTPLPLSLFPLGLPPEADPDDAAITQRLYFCIPPNDKLLGYWDRVDDRLFKLRNCLSLAGIRRTLPLFEPPIDPALLAKAAAQGIDIGTAIAALHAPLPPYRFHTYLSLAKELANHVAGLGGALLQALEKRDAEALALLRATQEVAMLGATRRLREESTREATATIDALREGRRVAETRLQHYRSLSVSELENKEISLRRRAEGQTRQAAEQTVLAAQIAMIPDIVFGVSGISSPVLTFPIGGTFFSRIIGIEGQKIELDASDNRAKAGLVATQATYERRQEDWELQVRLAERDIAQIDKQIIAAEIREAMAQIELANHDRQAEDSAAVLATMQDKFTNEELYAWMSGELSKLYFQAYNLAVELARSAERCYREELANTGESGDFITFGHWDNRRRGLLAGERLLQDIRRMEGAYYAKNRREYELTRRISLATLDPVALVELRKTGRCHFFVPETLFELDHPSHYFRRIKMVSVAVPAITGPHSMIHATLTYESGAIRRQPDLGLDIEELIAPAVESLALSMDGDDSGLFEPNLRDERYLPFEGKGIAHSSWRIELPAKIRSFDYETIADVVLTVRYTAREGGSVFGAAVEAQLPSALESLARAGEGQAERGEGLVRLFSARAEFPEAWRSFLAEGSDGEPAELHLDLSEARFPHPHQPEDRVIDRIAVFVRFQPQALPSLGVDLEGALLQGPGVTDEALSWAAYRPQAPAGYPDYVWFSLTEPLASEPGTFTVSLANGWPIGKEPEDLLLLAQYKPAN